MGEEATRVAQLSAANSRLAIVGWLLGLGYFQWLSASAPRLDWAVHAALIVGGALASSLILGGGVTLFAALLNRGAYGDAEARPGLFKVAGLIAIMLAFFLAGYAAKIARATVF